MTTRAPPVPRNRLPSLAEVLRRSTRPPVDLYCYYLYLQREGSEDTLDFWLDVQQHENLCRAFFKDLRKTGRTVKEDWPRYHEYARTRGSIYGNVTGVRKGDDGGEDYGGEQQHHDQDSPYMNEKVSKAEREEYESEFGKDDLVNHPHPHNIAAEEPPVSPFEGDEVNRLASPTSPDTLRNTLRTPSPTANASNAPYSGGAYPLSPTLKALYPHDDAPTDGRRTSHSRRISTPAQPYIPRDSAINRRDLIASAERIYSRYLMPGADKEVYLPPSLRIPDFPLSASVLPTVKHPDYDVEADAEARIPDMFHAQKEYVYRAMEQDSFPRFLRSKAFGNLTPISALFRLGLGLLFLWIALSTAFTFIFMDTRPRSTRLWIILPFTFSIVNLVAHSYDLDPILVFMGLSETTPFRTIGIREPYVRKLLFGRALWVSFLSAAIVAILTVIFWAVPGKRL